MERGFYRRVALLGGLAAVLALVVAPSAGAAVFCVGVTGGDCTDTTGTIQDQLDQAAANAANDTLRLGAGVHLAPTQPGYSYVGPPNESLDIVGAGPGTVVAGAGVAQSRALDLTQAGLPPGNPLITVSDLTIRAAGTLSSEGIRLEGVLRRVRVDSPPSDEPVWGVLTAGEVRIEDSEIAIPNPGPGIGIGVRVEGDGVPGSGDLTIDDSHISSDTTIYIWPAASSAVIIRRTELEAARMGLTNAERGGIGADTQLSSSLIRLTTPQAGGILVEAGSVAEDNVTIVAEGGVTPPMPGTFQSPIAAQVVVAESDASLHTRSSIHMTPNGFLRESQEIGTQANITVTNSRFEQQSPADNGGEGAFVEGAGNTAADPRFVTAPTDMRLRGDSPLIDAGADAGGADESLFDFGRLPRIVDGDGDGVARRDMGAYEYQPQPATPTPADTIAPAVSGFVLSRKRFRVGRKPTPLAARRKRRAKAGTTIRYRLSENATVTFTIERTLPGRLKRVRGKRRCVRPTPQLVRAKAKRCKRYRPTGKLTRQGTSGPDKLAFSGRVGTRALRPGKHRLTLQATDLAGNKSRASRRNFTIARR